MGTDCIIRTNKPTNQSIVPSLPSACVTVHQYILRKEKPPSGRKLWLSATLQSRLHNWRSGYWLNLAPVWPGSAAYPWDFKPAGPRLSRVSSL